MAETADTLRWTALRHRILREVGVGDPVRRIRYWPVTKWDPDLFVREKDQLSGPQRTTLRALLVAGLIQQGEPHGDYGSFDVALTNAGDRLLTEWSWDHPEIGEEGTTR